MAATKCKARARLRGRRHTPNSTWPSAGGRRDRPTAGRCRRTLEAERACSGRLCSTTRQPTEAFEDHRRRRLFRAAHRTLFERMVRLQAKRQAFDVVTLKEDPFAAGLLEEIGRPGLPRELLDGQSRSANVKGYARDRSREGASADADRRSAARCWPRHTRAWMSREILASARAGHPRSWQADRHEGLRVDGLHRGTGPRHPGAGQPAAARRCQACPQASPTSTTSRGFQPGDADHRGAARCRGEEQLPDGTWHRTRRWRATSPGSFSLEMENDGLFIR